MDNAEQNNSTAGSRSADPRQVKGVLDIMPDGYGFLRSPAWSFVSGPEDVYVPPPRIQALGLRRGDTVVGTLKGSRRGDRYLAIESVQLVNGLAPGSLNGRPEFDALRAWYPDRRLRLETPGGPLSTRIVDLVAPLGFGQRGLIVSPPKAGKTTILRELANAVRTNRPEAELAVLLIDERPEEVTEMEDAVPGAVVASTFDEPATRHRQVAEMVLEKAKRAVEMGRDAVVLLDSLTRLARAYNLLAPHSGRLLSGGVDANALAHPKRFFGSARSLENGGSLTIVATALVDTGSRMDQVIFEEFKGTGNMELVLDRSIADRRVYPAIDLNRSGTRREELLLSQKELNRAYLLRNFVGTMDAPDAAAFVIEHMRRHRTNADFLTAMSEG